MKAVPRQFGPQNGKENMDLRTCTSERRFLDMRTSECQVPLVATVFAVCEEGKTIPVGKTWTSEQGTSEWMVKSTQQSFQVCSEQGSQS